MNLRKLDSVCRSHERRVCYVPGSQFQQSMVSVSWFEGLSFLVPWSHRLHSRVSLFGCTESCTKGWAREAHFQTMRLAGAIARKWLSPAEYVLIGDGTWRGVEPPPPRFRLLSLRHTPSMTLNLGGGTSFLFANKVPVPPRPSLTASFAYGKRPRREATSSNRSM